MIDLIKQHCAELEELCRQYRVKTLEVFGSAVDGTWNPARSDVDLLVNFLPQASERSFAGFFDLKERLQQLFQRKVNLVMPGAIRNPYFFRAVNQHRQVVYAA